jgi:prepilin-type N-terminal cleavage/methylation domain-containing protein
MSRRTQRRTTPRPGFTPSGFTLTELLIVMGIIVLVSLIAVPSFRALTGGRSTEAAANQLSAVLGRARAEAIGLQEVRGIAFLVNTDSGLPTAVLVHEVPSPQWPTSGVPTEFNHVQVYLDAVPDRDMLALPAGVGIQLVDDCAMAAGGATPDPSDDKRGDDAYLGYNTYTTNMAGSEAFKFAGVVLFDAFGHLVDKEYAFIAFRGGVASNIAGIWHMTVPNKLAFRPGRPNVETDPTKPANPTPTRSTFGFVLFDQDAFDNLEYTAGDPQCDAAVDGATYTDDPANDTARSPEAREERWIDANATPFLVSRNNGTLLRGQ